MTKEGILEYVNADGQRSAMSTHADALVVALHAHWGPRRTVLTGVYICSLIFPFQFLSSLFFFFAIHA